MNNQKQSTCNQKNQIKPKSLPVKLIPVLNKLRFIKPLKCDHFLVSNSRGNSGVGVRALTGLNTASALNVQTAQLTLMNRSAVIPARSWGSKGVNLFGSNTFTMSLNRHGVTSVDLFNILPTNQVMSKGIYNFNSFIKENNFRMNKDLIADQTNQSSPNTGNDQSKVKSIINDLQIEHRGHYPKSHARKNVTTFRAKNLRIIHQSIFSCTSEKQVA